MSQFDANEYFRQRFGTLTDQKQDSLVQAMDDKLKGLAEFQASMAAATPQILALEEAKKNSWAGQLDLEHGEFGANRVNDVASLLSGGARLAGHVSTAILNLDSAATVSSVPQEDLDAWNRTKTGQPLPGDAERLARVDPNRPSGGSIGERLTLAEQQRTASRKINDAVDISSIVDPTNRHQLNQDLGKDFQRDWDQTKDGWQTGKDGELLKGGVDVAAGLGGLMVNAFKALGSNPSAVREYVLENAPQLFVGAMGPAGIATMSASNLGYAADTFQQGIEAYAKANNGQLPSEEQMGTMAKQAAALALAEQVGDVVGLGLSGLGKLGKAGKAATDGAEESAEAIRKSFKATLADSLKAVTKATAGGTATEAPTEGVQTYLEGEITGKPVSAKDIYTASVIGGASGGTLAGGGRSVAEVIGATPERAAAKAKEQEAAVGKAKELVAAIATGDVSKITDPTKPNYAPDRAIAALFGNSQKEGVTAEQKSANLEKANQILADLQEQHDNAKDALDQITVDGLKRRVAGYEAELADPNISAERKALLEQVLPIAREELTSFEQEGESKQAVAGAQAKVSQFARLLGEASKNRDALSQLVLNGTDVDSLVATLSTAPADDADTAKQVQASAAVITLAMNSPDQLSPEVARSLADNTSNGLSAEQRTYLRAFSAARLAHNAAQGLSGVRKEILTGSDKNLGVTQHRSRISAAIASGKRETATKALGLLKGFAVDHVNKAKAATEALATKAQIVSDGKRGWSINTGALLTGKAAKENGALVVHSPTLVENINAEADAIRTAYAEMKAAYDLKFSSAPANTATDGAANVPNQSQQGTGAQAQPEATAVQDPTPAGTGSTEGNSSDVLREVSGEEAKVAQKAQSTQEPSGSSVNTEEAQKEGTTQRQEPRASNNTANPEDVVNPETPVNSADEVASDVTAAPVVQEPGTLTALNDKSPAGTEFKKKSFGDFFTQLLNREGDATSRPLVAVKDFLAQLKSNVTSALAYLKQDELEANQKNLLQLFVKAAGDWDSVIRANLFLSLKEGQELFRYNDMMQYLVQKTDQGLDLDANVKTAIAYSVFSWVAENGTRSRFNNDEEINAILDRDDNALVSQEERAALAHIGTRQNVVVNALGQRIVDALGLQALQNVPANLMPDLVSALGAHAFKLLMDRGMVQREFISAAQMAELRGDTKVSEGAEHSFVTMVYSEDNKLDQRSEAIVKAMRGTQAVLDRLFSVEPGMKEPSFEAIPFIQAKAKNSERGVPEMLAKILEQENATPFFVRQDMWHLMSQLSDEVMLEIAGAEHVVDSDGKAIKHAANRGSVEAANNSLMRELDNFRQFVEQMDTDGRLDAGLYFDHVAWKQQRVGIATNVINPQSSKLHRHMLFRQAWDTEVDTTDDAQMQNFRLRVAEGLGIKTDKKSFDAALVEFDALFNEQAESQPQRDKAKALNQAVNVLVKTLSGQTITAGEQQLLLEGVQAGGEKMHSLDALMALAQQRFAQANGQTKFKTQLMGEVDGVTNGPMLSHLLLGAASSAKALFGLLNRGGFFEQGNEHTQYNLWREAAGHFDLYETTAGNMTQAVIGLISTGIFNKDGKQILSGAEVNQITSAIYAFTGALVKDGKVTKDGRNIVKTPLTAMVFGSSTAKAVDSMANNFIESIYTGIEDVAAGKKDRVEILAQINTLLRLSKQPTLPSSMTTEQLMEFQFNGAQIDGLKRAFKNTIGRAVKSTMEQDFAAFIEQRRQMNETAQFAFTLYNSVYTSMRAELINELIQKGEIAVNKVGKPLHDLTNQQEAELRKRLRNVAPVLHTLMSKQSGSLHAGMTIAKSHRKLSQIHGNEVKFGTKFADNKAGSTRTHSYERTLQDPGVAMAVMSVHSLDSFISHMALQLSKLGALNIHDAHGAGLANFNEVAQNLNAATWQALLEYSPASEMSEALSRTIRGLAEAVLNEDGFPVAAVEALVNQLTKIAAEQEVAPADLLALMLGNAKAAAYMADKVKLEAMAQMGAIDQYALQGGNYVVTDSDRAAAQAKLDALTGDLTAEEQAALQTLRDLMTQPAATAKVEAAQPTKTEAVKAEEKQAAVEQDTPLQDAEVLNIPTTHAMQLVEHAAEDVSLAQEVRDRLTNIAALMMATKKRLKDSLLLTVQGVEAAQLVQLLADRYNAIPKSLFWGRGTPKTAPHPSLVKFFDENPDVGAKRVIEGLFRLYEKDTSLPNREFNRTLLKQLYKTISPELKVRYVTSATVDEMVLSQPANAARGWYSFSDGAQEIYVLSPEFKHSGLTPEVLIHELVHGALAYTIELELAKRKQNPDYTSDALKLIDDLEALREKAKAYAAKNGITKYTSALNDVQEFVAWGMTNQGFQTEVLSQITMQSKTRKNELVTGLKEFIRTLTGLFFKDSGKSSQAVTVNGMTTLINNVSGLFAAVGGEDIQTKQAMTLAMSSPVAQLNTYSTLDIHNALNDGKVDPAFQDHLAVLLNSLVEKLHGPFGAFKAGLMENQALTPLDVWLKAQETGKAPFASKLEGAPFEISEQERFAMDQIEATVLAALDGSETRTKMSYRALYELYSEVSSRVKPRDFYDGNWETASVEAKAAAEAAHAFIFKIEGSVSGRSDYLARFAALGLGSQKFNRILQIATRTDTQRVSDGVTFAEKLQIVFENILNFFREKATHTYRGQKADAKLTALVEQLVDIEARNRTKLAHQAVVGTETLTDKAEEGVKKFTEGLRVMTEHALDSPFLRNSRNAVVRATGSSLRMVMGGRVDRFVDDLTNLRDKNFKGRAGMFAGLVKELKGVSDHMKLLLLARKHNEKLRQEIITSTAKSALKMFQDGKKLSKRQKTAITKVFLRTGAHALLPHLSMTELQTVMADPQTLDMEIAKLEQKLPKLHQGYYMEQIRALAYYKVTGEVTTSVLLMNAHNIARMVGQNMKVATDTIDQVEPLIAPLVALYALKYTDASHIKEATEILRTENQRTDEHGVEFILQLHQRFEQTSKETLFDNDASLMMHGYTAEIYNPYVEVITANQAEGEELIKLGYTVVSQVMPDPHDPDQEVRHLYKLRGAGLPPRVTGAMSNTGKQAKGSHKHSGFLNPLNQGGAANAAVNAGILNQRAALKKGANVGAAFDPRKSKQRYMAPIVNNAGDIVNWRYLMKESTKDTLLDRDNRFEHILGSIAGSIYDKPVSRQDNRIVVQALKEQYDAEYALQSHRYMVVGPDSEDPMVRETWALLPDETKRDIREVWGRDRFMVRNEDFYTIFGAQKLSAATMFKKANEERQENALQGFSTNVRDLESIQAWQKIVVGTVELVLSQVGRMRGLTSQQADDYARTAAVKVMASERVWRELVHEAKDSIVVKSGVVLLGNIKSNISLLLLQGVPLKDMAHHHLVAMKGAMSYKRDTDDLAHLRSLVESGYAATQGKEKVAEIEREILRLQDAIARNPITELVQAGLMPTIAEDVEMTDDPFSYKSQLAQKVEGVTARINPKVLGVAKQFYMTHDTGLYQGLARITQLSDFIARYTLFQHLTTRRDNPLSRQDAILQASDSFVNYDIPMQPGIQYLDDMGVIMFTKYFLRIQKVLLKTFKDKPARALSMVLLGNYFSVSDLAIDGSAVAHFGNNPIQSGAFKAFTSMDDMMTTQAALSLIK